jgi:hypothetical protein
MKPTKPAREAVFLLVSGFGVGWLIGLSVSPVVQSLLTALLGILTAVIAGLSGLALEKSKNGKDEVSVSKTPRLPAVTAVPFGLVMLGIIGGAATGVFFRTNDILGFQPGIFLQRWNMIPSEDKQRIAQKLIDTKGLTNTNGGGSVLYSGNADRCTELKGISGQELKQVLSTIPDKNVRRALALCQNENDLIILRTAICPED